MSWITLYPQWYVEERGRMAHHYPEFWVDEACLTAGELIYYGELVVRPTGGTVKHPVQMRYPEGTPFEPPVVVPLRFLPETNGGKRNRQVPQMLDHRHQMPHGALCLFQRGTRAVPGGDVVRGIDALRRAQQWFLGVHTGHWPPDSAESELEAHFRYATDVLLSGVFYSPEIDGAGQFFMVPDWRRLVDSRVEGICPMIVTAITEETDIVKVFDARKDLSRIYPWIQDRLWSPDKVAGIDKIGSNEVGKIEKGYWWSLPQEPRPFHDGRGLLRELSPIADDGDAWPVVSSTLRGEISLARNHFIGLRYPGRRGNVEWLMLLMIRGEREDRLLAKKDTVKRAEFERSPVFCLHVHSARPAELRLRNTGVISDVIQNKVVALIGLGALGSTVAELLAKAGVSKLRLCDCDQLSTGNVARHVGGLNEFGAPKTRVVMRRLFEINPYLRFADGDVITGSAVSSLDELARFMEAADLIVSTTADEGVESIINQVAVLHQKTVIYGRSLRRGSMGRVFLVRPGTDACKGCLASYARSSRQGKEVPNDWIDVIESEDDALLHECGRPVIPASAIDMSFVAALIARVALDVLEGNDGDTNHWLWSRLSAPEVDARLDRELCTFAGRLKPTFCCSACQEPDVVRLFLSEVSRDTIVSTTESSLNAETCGVLIGFVDDERRAVALRATRPGPRAERSREGCIRDTGYIQQELESAAFELGSRGVYIGEWHSHLVSDPEPSPMDIESLLGISMAPNYLTRCPVMLIVGLDPSTGKVAGIKSWAFPIGGRVYPIPIDIG
jgi:integrative and conjugative element protein (TIGR02256 family)